jgi:8-oxo-dGTP pyrophosphatase MutT (NUDIX family)
MDAIPPGAPRPVPADLLRWCDACNAPPSALAPFLPLRVGGADVGLVAPEFAALLAEHGDAFRVTPTGRGRGVALAPALEAADAGARTAAMHAVFLAMRDAGHITGWRGEPYPVATAFGAPPLALVERAAAPWLGVRSYGVHVNGYVVADEELAATDPGSGISLWVATRAATKPTWPGRLDHVVAGGQPAGLSPRANVVKECGEEAGIPPALAAAAVAAGAVSYEGLAPGGGAKRDVLFVYDLRLPRDFVPTVVDGEVDSFELVPLSAVAALAAHTDRFKDNVNLVLADFLLRRGFWEAGAMGYLDLVAGVRRGALQ